MTTAVPSSPVVALFVPSPATQRAIALLEQDAGVFDGLADKHAADDKFGLHQSLVQFFRDLAKERREAARNLMLDPGVVHRV